MKKFYALLAATFVAASAWAEAPELLFDGNPVEDGKTYETGYTVEDLGFMQIYEQNANLSLKGLVGADVVVNVKADHEIAFCSGMDCVNAKDITKTIELGTVDVISEDDDYCTISLRIDVQTTSMGESIEGKMDNVDLEVTAYYVDAPGEVATAHVIMRNVSQEELGGINDVKTDASICIGHANQLNYNVSTPTKLDIYNVNGGLVMSRTIYQSGTLSLDSLHPGVYIYSAAGKAGKVLIHK